MSGVTDSCLGYFVLQMNTAVSGAFRKLNCDLGITPDASGHCPGKSRDFSASQYFSLSFEVFVVRKHDQNG